VIVVEIRGINNWAFQKKQFNVNPEVKRQGELECLFY
jgi:hypothetical protein